MRAMKVHWKPEWIKRQVFRKPVRPTGCWVKSKTEPMLYSAYAFYINRLGRNTGFEDELTSYCFRLELHFVRRRVRLFSPNTFHDLGTRRTCTVPQTLRRRLQCPLSSTVDVGFPPQSIGPSQLSADDGEESTTASTVPTPVAPGATDAAAPPFPIVEDPEAVLGSPSKLTCVYGVWET